MQSDFLGMFLGITIPWGGIIALTVLFGLAFLGKG